MIRLSAAALAVVVACASSEETANLDIIRVGSGAGSVGAVNSSAIECGSKCTHSFAVGAEVTLLAIPHSGSSFSGWTGPCTGKERCTVSMTSHQSVTAVFDAVDLDLTVATTGPGRGRVRASVGDIDCGTRCLATYPYGQRVALYALPEPGFAFGGWSGACDGTGPCGVTMTSSRSATALFVSDTVQVIVRREGDGLGVVEAQGGATDCGMACAARLPRGSTLELFARPLASARFAG